MDTALKTGVRSGGRVAAVSPAAPSASSWLEPQLTEGARAVIRSPGFERFEAALPGGGVARIDRFPQHPGASCTFLRFPVGEERDLALQVDGQFHLQACAQGGWLLMPRDDASPAYWIPTLPTLRQLDALGHVTAERSIEVNGLCQTDSGWRLDVHLPAGWCLDCVAWRFAPEQLGVVNCLQQPSNLERQPVFLWGSKVNCRLPTDLYRYLLHGELYTDDFVWPRKWKFHSEIDAQGIYVALDGLETSTCAVLYGLLKRQVLYSVMLRQAADGGWYHGEWTDLMESHYRLHNSAMSVLEAGLEEYGDESIRVALAKAAGFLSTCTDHTDIGTWFLHDSLERSVEAMEIMRQQTNTPWIPSRVLGKSPTNKLILNTHLDALVVLDRYAALTGDATHAEIVRSGCDAATRLLAMRPANALYRLLYQAINLTLLPQAEAAALPVHLRVVKRLTWMHLLPRMHRIKRVFPRLVMPGGLIERHIAPMHYDVNYHPVNVLDLARMRRRFAGLDLRGVIDDAVAAVSGSRLLEYWAEAKNRRFAVVVWAEALYQLCLLDEALALRQQLARTMLLAIDADLGMPPSLLGGDTEAIERSQRRPCPSARDRRLHVANLGCGPRIELIVVNPTQADRQLDWEANAPGSLGWSDAAGRAVAAGPSGLRVPARGWLRGLGEAPHQGDA